MDDQVRALALCALVACQGGRSAEKQEEFAQKVEDQGGFGLELTFAPSVGEGNDAQVPSAPRFASSVAPAGPATGHPLTIRFDPAHPEAFLDGLPEHGLLLSAKVTGKLPSSTSTQAATEGHSASSYRFGFSPWQWAIGGLVALAGLWGLFRLKTKLNL